MLKNFLPRFARPWPCSARARARGFTLRGAHGGAHGDAHGGAHGGAHGDGKRRAEQHAYQSKFSAGVVLREHTADGVTILGAETESEPATSPTTSEVA